MTPLRHIEGWNLKTFHLGVLDSFGWEFLGRMEDIVPPVPRRPVPPVFSSCLAVSGLGNLAIESQNDIG